MTATLSNSLTELADRVRDELSAAATAEKAAIDGVLTAGGLLREAKGRCKHGEWLTFLERSSVPERTAQRYMRLSWAGLKSDTVSDLGGIKAALRWADGLRMPKANECLVVSLDNFTCGLREPLAVVWRDGGGQKFAIFNPVPGDSWIDLLAKPLLKDEYILPALYAALNNRHRDMSFQIVKRDQTMIDATESLAGKTGRAA